jgi:hypothetical protein
MRIFETQQSFKRHFHRESEIEGSHEEAQRWFETILVLNIRIYSPMLLAAGPSSVDGARVPVILGAWISTATGPSPSKT